MSWDREHFRVVLQEGLASWGLSSLSEKLQDMVTFAELILETNQEVNLTRIVEAEEMAVKNFLDSLSLLQLDWPEQLRALDLGTGAGFPGVPLAIVRPQWEVVLLDSLRKRLSFLERACAELGVHNTEVLHARAEDAGRAPEHREQYDLVVSRAVAALPVLLELAVPLVKVGGCFAAYKGADARAELEEAKGALKKLKIQVEQVFPLELPHGMGQRSLLIFRKEQPTPARYPRRAGLPQKKPLQ